MGVTPYTLVTCLATTAASVSTIFDRTASCSGPAKILNASVRAAFVLAAVKLVVLLCSGGGGSRATDMIISAEQTSQSSAFRAIFSFQFQTVYTVLEADRCWVGGWGKKQDSNRMLAFSCVCAPLCIKVVTQRFHLGIS